MKLTLILAAVVLALAGAGARAAPPEGLVLSMEERAAIVEAFGRAGQPAPDPAAGDAALWRAAERLASAELSQGVRPSAIDPLWDLSPAARDVPAEMLRARETGGLSAWLAGLSPDDARYAGLARARLHYGRIVAQGGWEVLPAGLRLRPGDAGPGVAALRRRLGAEGDAPAEPVSPEVFDAPLRRALAAWQERNDLEDDGVLGPATLARLNVPAAVRLGQVDANMERWRWLPRSLPADRLEIDTGGAVGALYRQGRVVHAFRVIPGAVRDPTPIFQSRIHSVVLNPPWNVPDRIAREELFPKAARDPGYLARNGFVRIGGRLQQQPGPKSALGLVKFDLNSPFGVYLHDTPGRDAFRRSERHLSHGCMRVENPLVLADLLLGPQGRGGSRMKSDLATGATLRISLTRQEPLLVVHWTVRPGADGRAGFLDDVYGWDARLASVLAGM